MIDLKINDIRNILGFDIDLSGLETSKCGDTLEKLLVLRTDEDVLTLMEKVKDQSFKQGIEYSEEVSLNRENELL